MKKLTGILLLVGGLMLNAHAQFFSQGSVIGNGSFLFESGKYKDGDVKGSNFSLMPSAAYFIIDNLGVGGELNLSTSSGKSGDYKTTSSGFALGPWVRYYADMGVFGEFSFLFGSSNLKETQGGTTTKTKYSSTDLFIGGGYSIRLADNVYFDPAIGYFSQGQKVKDSDTKSTYGGVRLKAGFTVRLK